ncbi:MAG: CoA transferase, partial [Candidatus Lambdaproteobacteria bacterium]|nr:CoA transferase [Candidatus Lambdaproteobacteria bacterium]
MQQADGAAVDRPGRPARPLEGIVVAERAGRLAGGVCAMLLLQLGARVVRFERPDEPLPLALEGEAAAALRAFLQVGRERVRYDPAAFAGLLERVPVAIAAPVAPGDDPDVAAILARRERLVGCIVTPYGLAGPAPDMPPAGDELALQAVSGIMATTGEEGGPPLPAPLPLAELVAGVNAAAAALAGLRVLERGGGGQVADIALFDALLGLMGTFMPLVVAGQRGGFRIGCRHPLTAPWNVYPTADARIIICTSTDAHWQRILALAGRNDLVQEPRFASPAQRVAHGPDVDGVVSGWSRRLPTRDAIALLAKAGVPVGAVLSIPELLADEGFVARGMVRRVTDEGGRPRVLAGAPLHFSRAESVFPERVQPLLPAPPHVAAAPPDSASDSAPGDGHGVGRGGEPGGPMPLAGMQVVEIGLFTAGPMAARNLATLGADVVKVEGLEGEPARRWAPACDGIGHYFLNCNCDKRSLAVDLKRPEGRQVVERLCARADVLIENLRPGALERLGLGYRALSLANPRLVYFSLSGYGLTGPGSAKAAYDTVIQAETGLVSLLNPRVPVKIGVSIADMMGAQFAPAAILAALRQRDRDGAGQHIDMSMQDCTAWLGQLSWPAGTGGLPPWHRLEAADGFVIAMAAEARVAAALAGVDARARTCGELVRLLRAAGVAAERVRELDEALYGEQARRRDLLPERPSRRGTGV